MSTKTTAGVLERFELCPPSAHGPQGLDVDAEWPRLGTEGHGFLCAMLLRGRDEALAEIEDPAARERCAAIRVDRLPAAHPDGYRAEVGVALDVVTGKARIVGAPMTHVELVAALMSTEVGGVIDILGLTPDKTTAIVIDYKFGWRRLTPARSNRQIQLYAIAAARALGCSRAVGALVFVRCDERDPWSDVATFQRVDLDEIFDDVVGIVWRVAEAKTAIDEGRPVDLTRGNHCDFCPAFNGCREQTGLLRMWAAAPEQAATAAFEAVSDARIEDAIREADDIERVLKRVRQAIHARATVQPVKLSNGLVYGPVVQERDEIDGKKGQAALVDPVTWFTAWSKACGDAPPAPVPTDADVARVLSWRVTKRAVQTLAAARAPKGKATKLAEAVVEQIRALGGVSKRINVAVKAHNPGEDKERNDA